MKKFSFIVLSLFLTLGSYAQCVVDNNLAVLDSTAGGYYPDANHIPHIVVDSPYLQTVQGKIMSSQTQTVNIPSLGNVPVTLTIDTVRLDSLIGLPTGITWTKSSDILTGGGLGCVQFSGVTTDTPGVYHIQAVGLIRVAISALGGLFTQHDSSYGSLERLPAYGNFFLVVDSAASPLSATMNARTNCNPNALGSATVTPSGGSSVAPYTYLWNNGVTSYTISNLTAGTYYVTVTSGVDTLTDSVVVAGDPTPLSGNVTGNTIDSNAVQMNGSATVVVTGGVPPYTYRWNNRDTTASIDSLRPGTYRVTVRDSLGCTFRDSIVIVNLTAGIIQAPELNAKVVLYPNPASDVVTMVVQSPVTLNARIEALDITGKVVYAAPADITSGSYTHAIDVKSFSPGIYILQLSSDNQSLHQRFVVTR